MCGCLESGAAGGGGTAFVDGSGIAVVEDRDVRSADAGTMGCEKGLPGPRGASANDETVADPGADGVVKDWPVAGMSALFRASDIEGRKVEPLGDSLSSLVDRREFVSGGDI